LDHPCGVFAFEHSGETPDAPASDWARRAEAQHHCTTLYKDVSRWIFTGSLAVFLPTAFLAKDVLAVIGREFVPGGPVMVVIAAAQLFGSSVGLMGRVLATARHKRRGLCVQGGRHR
jgi:ABC-type antimicrobial peptide transport system permease subunit